MSSINLYFVTIRGKRIITTLPEHFQLSHMLQEIRNKINDTAVENCIFLCKGRRLSLDDPDAFDLQKRKFINDGSVIFIGNKITNCNWNQTTIKTNKSEPLIKIYFITATGQQIIVEISEQFQFIDFLKIMKQHFGEDSIKTSRFICMGEELKLKDRASFEQQKRLIRNGSIILETVRSKKNSQNNQDQLWIEKPNSFGNIYIFLSILFFLICCIKS